MISRVDCPAMSLMFAERELIALVCHPSWLHRLRVLMFTSSSSQHTVPPNICSSQQTAQTVKVEHRSGRLGRGCTAATCGDHGTVCDTFTHPLGLIDSLTRWLRCPAHALAIRDPVFKQCVATRAALSLPLSGRNDAAIDRRAVTHRPAPIPPRGSPSCLVSITPLLSMRLNATGFNLPLWDSMAPRGRAAIASALSGMAMVRRRTDAYGTPSRAS